MTCRHLREAHFVGEARGLALMVWMRISMHEHDGDGVDAVGACGFQRGARGGNVEQRLHAAVGAHALRHFGDGGIEHRWLLDLPREDLWPGLVADFERVAEAFAHQQQHAIALALEERIGGDGGAHLDAFDHLRRQRMPARHAKQVADARGRRVSVGLRILREELVGKQPPVRRPRHDVGEGAAAVDAELPGALACHPSRISPAAYCFQRRT